MNYSEFLDRRTCRAELHGFAPTAETPWLFPFQSSLVEWAVRRGRAALFADCGLGKTPMQLAWAQHVIEHTNKPVLVIAPLSASAQTIEEAKKFGVDAYRSRDGVLPGRACVIVTNYERLHYFSPADFGGVVCDESSILKNFDGATRQAVTQFLRRVEFRLLCTATAAPNDYIELGTSSEALGELGYADMLTRFFTNDEHSIKPLSYATAWRFKGHAEQSFWRWMATWARAVRKPSDVGFDDDRFVLPPLRERVKVIDATRPLSGKLFVTPAETLSEQREERRATLRERCEAVAELAEHDRPFIAWAHLNDEADLLEELIPDSAQVSGSDSDEKKEEIFEAFRYGRIRAIVTKPKIASFGLNWQHCAHMSFFPSHSYEQYYQSVRRCWRFGQTDRVTVDIVTTAGEADVMGNLRRKATAADQMFASMVAAISRETGVQITRAVDERITLPSWARVNQEQSV